MQKKSSGKFVKFEFQKEKLLMQSNSRCVYVAESVSLAGAPSTFLPYLLK